MSTLFLSYFYGFPRSEQRYFRNSNNLPLRSNYSIVLKEKRFLESQATNSNIYKFAKQKTNSFQNLFVLRVEKFLRHTTLALGYWIVLRTRHPPIYLGN